VRDSERLLVALNIAGSASAGWTAMPIWFAISASAFGAYLVIEDRALRRRIGSRAWPSEGFARFSFNTNLNFALTQTLLGAALFAGAAVLRGGLAT
jgi:hypothetical protein